MSHLKVNGTKNPDETPRVKHRASFGTGGHRPCKKCGQPIRKPHGKH